MTTLPLMPAGSGRRSTLVSAVGWLFLVCSALATIGALFQVFVMAVAPAAVNKAVDSVAHDTAFTQLLPRPYRFMLYHVHLVALIKLAWWGLVLVASVGVLKRKEWARRTFLAVLAMGIAALLIGFAWGDSFVMALGARIASTSGRGQMPPGMGSGIALAGFTTVAIAGALLWLLFAFRSARVREEFAGSQRAA